MLDRIRARDGAVCSRQRQCTDRSRTSRCSGRCERWKRARLEAVERSALTSRVAPSARQCQRGRRGATHTLTPQTRRRSANALRIVADLVAAAPSALRVGAVTAWTVHVGYTVKAIAGSRSRPEPKRSRDWLPHRRPVASPRGRLAAPLTVASSPLTVAPSPTTDATNPASFTTSAAPEHNQRTVEVQSRH